MRINRERKKYEWEKNWQRFVACCVFIDIYCLGIGVVQWLAKSAREKRWTEIKKKKNEQRQYIFWQRTVTCTCLQKDQRYNYTIYWILTSILSECWCDKFYRCTLLWYRAIARVFSLSKTKTPPIQSRIHFGIWRSLCISISDNIMCIYLSLV